MVVEGGGGAGRRAGRERMYLNLAFPSAQHGTLPFFLPDQPFLEYGAMTPHRDALLLYCFFFEGRFDPSTNYLPCKPRVEGGPAV